MDSEAKVSTVHPAWDVVVVGAGISGLTAAYRLQQQQPNCSVLVLEAKDRVGGRTFSTEMRGASGTDTWDLGGQWVGSTQYHLLWLLEELGLEKYPQYTTGWKQMLLGNNKGIRTYKSSIPSLSPMALLDMYRFITLTDKLSANIPLDDPMKATNAEVLDGTTLESLIRQNTWTQGKGCYPCIFRHHKWCPPSMMSALFFMHYVRSSGNIRILVEADGDSNNSFRIKGGAQQVSKLLVERIGKEKVLLSHPVVHIQQEEVDKVTVVTAEGREFTCRYVVVAAPIHCSAGINYTPTKPLDRIGLANHSPVGHLIKFIVTYKSAFWREDGLSGEIVSHGGKPTIRGTSSGPVHLTYDCTTSNGNPGIVGFYANSREWSHIQPEVRRNAVLNSLAEFFGPKAKEPLDYYEKDWALEPYNGGCPINIMTPGAMTYFYKGLRTPFGRVHWAGAETATHHEGFMSGAVQSGLRVASEVLTRLDPLYRGDDLLLNLDNKRVGVETRNGHGWMWSVVCVVGVVTVTAFLFRRFLLH